MPTYRRLDLTDLPYAGTLGMSVTATTTRASKPRYVRPNDSYLSRNKSLIPTEQAGDLEFMLDCKRYKRTRKRTRRVKVVTTPRLTDVQRYAHLLPSAHESD